MGSRSRPLESLGRSAVLRDLGAERDQRRGGVRGRDQADGQGGRGEGARGAAEEEEEVHCSLGGVSVVVCSLSSVIRTCM